MRKYLPFLFIIIFAISNVYAQMDSGNNPRVEAVALTDSGNGDLKIVNTQHPLSVDGDSVYEKDIEQSTSTSVGFTGGSVIDLFNDRFTVLTNTTTDNPKTIVIRLKRPIQTNIIAIACVDGTFSNTEIYATVGVGIGSIDIPLIDESADNTAKSLLIPTIGIVTFSTLTIKFHTANPVCLSYVGIAKTVQAISRIQGANPSGTIVNFQATAGGNFKMSLEELENNISVNSNTQLRTTLYDENGRDAQIDSATYALINMGYEHHEIHSGSHYFVCGYDPDMDSGEEVDFKLVTPDTTTWTHMTFSIQGTGEVVFSIYEDATYSTIGTTVTAYNNDRNSVNTSGMALHSGATVLTSGTTIYQQAFGYAANPTRVAGGTTEREKEIILKQDTIYRFRIQSNSDNNIVSWCGEWYEHTNKE